MSVQNYPGRMNYGAQAEQAFILWCCEREFFYWKIGKEFWLPQWVHKKIWGCNDFDILLLRHIPDFSVRPIKRNFLVQVKAAPRAEVNVTLEVDDYVVSERLAELKIPVLYLWLLKMETFVGQWFSRFSVRPIETKEGSGTPTYLVPISELRPIESFFYSQKSEDEISQSVEKPQILTDLEEADAKS